jgi:hypothetical protein
MKAVAAAEAVEPLAPPVASVPRGRPPGEAAAEAEVASDAMGPPRVAAEGAPAVLSRQPVAAEGAAVPVVRVQPPEVAVAEPDAAVAQPREAAEAGRDVAAEPRPGVAGPAGVAELQPAEVAAGLPGVAVPPREAGRRRAAGRLAVVRLPSSRRGGHLRELAP